MSVDVDVDVAVCGLVVLMLHLKWTFDVFVYGHVNVDGDVDGDVDADVGGDIGADVYESLRLMPMLMFRLNLKACVCKG